MEATQEKSLHMKTLRQLWKSMRNRNAVCRFGRGSKTRACIARARKKRLILIALDLREIASFTEFFVIASGANQRQVQAISDEINEQLKKATKLATDPHRRL